MIYGHNLSTPVGANNKQTKKQTIKIISFNTTNQVKFEEEENRGSSG